MPEELRVAYHRDLEEIEEKVVALFALVAEGVAAATEALLSDDRKAAAALAKSEELIERLYHDVEELVQHQFALQSPMAGDLRFLLSVLRIVPELERSGDLAEHIARKASRGLTSELSPRVRGLIEQMGSVGVDMWRKAADAFTDRNAAMADELEDQDDELDELHVSLIAELVGGGLPVPVGLELALIARFYERLGDHAVNVTKRVRFLATGQR